MQDVTTVISTSTIGIDLGDRFSHHGMLDADGSVIDEERLSTSPAAFRLRFAKQPRARIAIEVGTRSAWVNELLKEASHEVLVANARMLAVLLHCLWVTGDVYEPLRNTHKRETTKTASAA